VVVARIRFRLAVVAEASVATVAWVFAGADIGAGVAGAQALSRTADTNRTEIIHFIVLLAGQDLLKDLAIAHVTSIHK
jgi:hypothetical protein